MEHAGKVERVRGPAFPGHLFHHGAGLLQPLGGMFHFAIHIPGLKA